jgi:type IV pilus assembly protein PilW
MGNLTTSTVVPPIVVPATLPDPCLTDAASLRAALPIALQGVDAPTGVPSCLPDHVPGTDVLVVRRAHTTTTPAAGAVANTFYTQISGCDGDGSSFLLAQAGFSLHQSDCATLAPLRQYHVEIYYVSPCSIATGSNGACASSDPAVPSLKRLELRPASDPTCQTYAQTNWCVVPLVEGIENVQYEYGLDTNGDGAPDVYKPNPASVADWSSVMTVRINVVSRDITQTAGFTDSKTYDLGMNADGSANKVTPGGAYKRHAHTEIVRLNTVSQRLEQPLCRAPTTDC